MLSPTVIGVVLHRLGLKYNFGQVEVQRGEAELDFNLTEIVLHWSCTRWSTTDSNQVHRGQVEVQRGEAELDFNLAEMDLTEVARGGPALTPLKATESKSKFNEAQPSWTWTWTRWPWAEVARGGEQVHQGQVHRGQVEVQRGEAELNFNLAEMDLALMYLFSSECNFSAMLTSWEASTPRRSRGVLVLPTSQHCSRVNAGLPSATSVQCWWVGRQVHRGGAEVYLSSLRVNIAEESVVDHRVQLQCKFDEKEGKYTEAKPRCTCPSYESNLHQVGDVQHQLPLDLMLVHFRPHLCHGYTDQYHSCKRSRVQWSLNRMEFWSTLEHLCFILFISLAKVIHFFGKFAFSIFLQWTRTAF